MALSQNPFGESWFDDAATVEGWFDDELGGGGDGSATHTAQVALLATASLQPVGEKAWVTQASPMTATAFMQPQAVRGVMAQASLTATATVTPGGGSIGGTASTEATLAAEAQMDSAGRIQKIPGLQFLYPLQEGPGATQAVDVWNGHVANRVHWGIGTSGQNSPPQVPVDWEYNPSRWQAATSPYDSTQNPVQAYGWHCNITWTIDPGLTAWQAVTIPVIAGRTYRLWIGVSFGPGAGPFRGTVGYLDDNDEWVTASSPWRATQAEMSSPNWAEVMYWTAPETRDVLWGIEVTDASSFKTHSVYRLDAQEQGRIAHLWEADGTRSVQFDPTTGNPYGAGYVFYGATDPMQLDGEWTLWAEFMLDETDLMQGGYQDILSLGGGLGNSHCLIRAHAQGISATLTGVSGQPLVSEMVGYPSTTQMNSLVVMRIGDTLGLLLNQGGWHWDTNGAPVPQCAESYGIFIGGYETGMRHRLAWVGFSNVAFTDAGIFWNLPELSRLTAWEDAPAAILAGQGALTASSYVEVDAGATLAAQASLTAEATVVGKTTELVAEASLQATAEVTSYQGRFGLTWRDGTEVRRLTSNVTYFHPDFAVTHVEKVPLLASRVIPGGLLGNFDPSTFLENDMCPVDSSALVEGTSIPSTYTTRLELRGDAPFLKATVTSNPSGTVVQDVVSTHTALATDVAGQPRSWVWVGHVPPALTEYAAPGSVRVGNWLPIPQEGSAPTQHVATYQATRAYAVPGKSAYTLNQSSGVNTNEQFRVDPASGLRTQLWPPFEFGSRLQDAPRAVLSPWYRRLWHASHPAGTYVPGDATWGTLNWVQVTETVYRRGPDPYDRIRYPVVVPWVRYLYNGSSGYFQEIVAYTRTGTAAPIFYARLVDFGGAAPRVIGFEGYPTFGLSHGLGLAHPENGDSIWRSPLGYTDLDPYMDITEEGSTADTYFGSLTYQWGALRGVGRAGAKDSLAICPVATQSTELHVGLLPGDYRDGAALQQAGLQAYQFDPAWPMRGAADVPGRLPETAVPMLVHPEPLSYQGVYTSSTDGIWVRWYTYSGAPRPGYFVATATEILVGKEPWVWACSLVPNEILVLAYDLEGDLGWVLFAVTLPPPPDGSTTPAVLPPPVSDLLSEQADEDAIEDRVIEVGLARTVERRGLTW